MLYNIRNIGQSVSLLRKNGVRIYNKETDGVFQYYYMTGEDIAKVKTSMEELDKQATAEATP